MSYDVAMKVLSKAVGSGVGSSLVDSFAPKLGKMVSPQVFAKFWDCVTDDPEELAIDAIHDLKRSRKYGGKLGKTLGLFEPDSWAGGHVIGYMSDCAKKAGVPEIARLWMAYGIAKFYDGWGAVKFYKGKIEAFEEAGDQKIPDDKNPPAAAFDGMPILLAAAAALVIVSS